MLNPPVNGKIQEVFKAFECFSSTSQGKFNFQGLFKTVLYIQVLFKPVGTLNGPARDILVLITYEQKPPINTRYVIFILIVWLFVFNVQPTV